MCVYKYVISWCSKLSQNFCNILQFTVSTVKRYYLLVQTDQIWRDTGVFYCSSKSDMGMDLQYLHFTPNKIQYYIYYIHRTTNFLVEILVFDSYRSSWFLYKSGNHILEDLNDFVYNYMPSHAQLIELAFEILHSTLSYSSFWKYILIFWIFFLLIIHSNCSYMYIDTYLPPVTK